MIEIGRKSGLVRRPRTHPALLPTDADVDSVPRCIDGRRVVMSRGGVVACCRLSPSLATSIAVAVAVALAIPAAGDAFGDASKTLGVDIQHNLGPDGLQSTTRAWKAPEDKKQRCGPFEDAFQVRCITVTAA